jgi:UDP-N-acetylmuramate dehydrogenase
MVLAADDPNRRSAGSFFKNPVLDRGSLHRLIERARSSGLIESPSELPHYDLDEARSKVPAAWLIEAAGFHKGYRRGAVGLSTRHVLALVHHGGGNTGQLLTLANEIREAVWRRFAVLLEPEPVLLGVDDEGWPTPIP